jgi:hypothetical protein
MDTLCTDVSGLRAKHRAEFAGQHFDLIRSFADPVVQQHAFAQTLRELQTRIHYLLGVIERKRKEQQ